MTGLPVYHRNIKFANWIEWCSNNNVNRKKFTCWLVVWVSYILKNYTIFWMEFRILLIWYILTWCPTSGCIVGTLITARQWNFGKLMFQSCLSVILSIGRGVPCDHYPWCIGTRCPGPLPWPQPPPRTWVSTVQVPLPWLVLTSGGYRSIYGWQAVGMHPTATLSCLHGVSVPH